MHEFYTPITDGLQNYITSGNIPWHMPGHKRKAGVTKKNGDSVFDGDVRKALSIARGMDVTEVPGLDDLHCPKEMILESENQLCEIYGTYRSYYLINGSTCGIMSAIAACKRTGIIVADNCHKSVLNTTLLLNIPVAYAKTKRVSKKDADTGCILPDIRGVVTPFELERVCKEHSDFDAVIITSPTYEGIISDIKALADIAHKYNKILIVDEAHGAHLPFFMPEYSAVNLGADIVIQSLHKTMESLTQTAVLHIVRECEQAAAIRKYLSVFMSSSPSYFFLASMELAVYKAANEREKDGFSGYKKRLDRFLSSCLALRNLKVVDSSAVNKLGAFGYDKTRIVLYGTNLISGRYLEKLLFEEGHIVSEMSGLDYVVLISTYMDDDRDFNVLFDTLKRVDNRMDKAQISSDSKIIVESDAKEYDINILKELMVGEIAKTNYYVYPPGIPIVREGEIITEEALFELIQLVEAGKHIRNM